MIIKVCKEDPSRCKQGEEGRGSAALRRTGRQGEQQGHAQGRMFHTGDENILQAQRKRSQSLYVPKTTV